MDLGKIMTMFGGFMRERGKEPSTWVGNGLVIDGMMQTNPYAQYAMIGMGLLGMLAKERGK